MKKSTIPQFPFKLEPKFAYYVGSLIYVVAETEEAIFVAIWDGVSPIHNEIQAYAKIELTN